MASYKGIVISSIHGVGPAKKNTVFAFAVLLALEKKRFLLIVLLSMSNGSNKSLHPDLVQNVFGWLATTSTSRKSKFAGHRNWRLRGEMGFIYTYSVKTLLHCGQMKSTRLTQSMHSKWLQLFTVNYIWTTYETFIFHFFMWDSDIIGRRIVMVFNFRRRSVESTRNKAPICINNCTFPYYQLFVPITCTSAKPTEDPLDQSPRTGCGGAVWSGCRWWRNWGEIGDSG